MRVAIIAAPSDLGAVGGLWRNPRAYARFLGLELSLAYKQRLLVVMPNGFGFNWPGHSTASAYQLLGTIPIGTGSSGLVSAAQTAVRELASGGGGQAPDGLEPVRNRDTCWWAGQRRRRVERRSHGGNQVAIVLFALGAVALAGLTIRRTLRRRRAPPRARTAPAKRTWALQAVSRRSLVSGVVLLGAIAVTAPIVGAG